MDNYRVIAKTEEFTSNIQLTDKTYAGWMCVNTGTAAATVLGYELQPGEGLDFLDAVPAGSVWDKPIAITVQTGGKIRMTRLQYEKLGK